MRTPLRRRGDGLPRGSVGRQRSALYTRTVGIGAIVTIAVIFYIGFQAPNQIPGRSYYNIYAHLRDADNLGGHYQVRIGGLLAGQVLNPEVEHGLAYLHLQLASRFGPLRTSTKIEIRLRSAVGIRYLQLIPGTTGPFLPQNGVLGPSSAGSPVNLDQVLNIFDARTRLRTQQFLSQLGEGLAGRGEDVNSAISTAPAFLNDLGGTAASINARTGAMHEFVSAAQGTANAFDPVRDTIATGLQPGTQALKPFTDRSAQVGSTLDDLPPTLQTVTNTLPAVKTLLAQANAFAAATRVTLAHAPAALRDTVSLLSNAQTPLRNLSKTLSLAQTAVPPTLSLLQAAPPALPTLNTGLNDLGPALTYLGPRACELSNGFSGWADGMKWGDGAINYIQFSLEEDKSIVAGSTAPIIGSSPGNDLANPYPGPCVNGSGEGGSPRPTPVQMAQGLTYTAGQTP
jgi:ABC-type transporter Mla subunit MlaD